MTWRQRERWVYWGAPLAIVPALAFLPLFVVLVVAPRTGHASVWAALLFPVMAVAEFVGIYNLARGCVARPFNLLTMISFGAVLVLLVIATYTGVFMVALLDRM
jgi:hypothetical protein